MSDRKARLAALASKAGRSKPTRSEEEDIQKPDDAVETGDKRALTFRNYAPNDESIDQQKSKKPRVEEQELQEVEPPSALQAALKEAKSEISTPSATKEIENMAPKKINWDLKRDIEKKLAKLERRTQKIIVELLKERLEREATEQASENDSSNDLD
jgi:coiled-coil domain-containing protein 12